MNALLRALRLDLVRADQRSAAGRHVAVPLWWHIALILAVAYRSFTAEKLKAVCLTIWNIGIRGSNPTRSTKVLLLEDGLPVIVITPSPSDSPVLHEKIVSNIQEVRARGAHTIVIAEEGDESVVPYAHHIIRVPACPTLLQPIVATVPLQVFACEMATLKGYDVDQPRNLAKSVTVE